MSKTYEIQHIPNDEEIVETAELYYPSNLPIPLDMDLAHNAFISGAKWFRNIILGIEDEEDED